MILILVIRKQIAEGIKSVFKAQDDVLLIKASQSLEVSIKNFDLLIVGSPTRAFKCTKTIKQMIKGFPKEELTNTKLLVFDTRISVEEVNSKVLNFFVKRFGYANKKIADALVKRGAKLLVEPEGFIVCDKEGPLKEGELTRAINWAESALK